MSPLSAPVLGGAAIVASPALRSALDGSMPMDVALTRYLIAVGICWAGISLVVEFALPGPGAVKARTAQVEPPETDPDVESAS